jgi:EmrB/QacA subfamily drug resistance transporter
LQKYQLTRLTKFAFAKPALRKKSMTERGSLADLQSRYGTRHRWLMLTTVMIGSMAAIMSSTIMNVGIPDMSLQFGISQELAQWVSSSFMVAMTVSMLTTPWLLARFGYRTTYMGCMLLLLSAGIAGGLSTDYNLVLGARVIEGLAAGVVQPIPAIIILRAFDTSEQGRANSFFGMGVVLAPALGPSIGGLLVDWMSWRALFFMVVPFCLISLWMAMRFVPTTAPGGVSANHGKPSLDLGGLTLATGGTLCLLNGLVILHSGDMVRSLTLICAAGLCAMGFVMWQRVQTQNEGKPLMNLSLFAHRPFAMGTTVAFIYGIALFGSTYLLPLYLQLGLGLSPSYVGTLLLPSGLMLAFTIAIVGRYSSTHPTHLMVSFGLVLLALSFALMLTVNLQTGLWVLVAFAILGRIGLGFILPSLNIGAMRGMDGSLIPQGASVINFLRMLGGAAGVNLCGILLEWRLAVHGDSLKKTATSVTRLAAFDEVFLMLAFICMLALLAAWRIRQPAQHAH